MMYNNNGQRCEAISVMGGRCFLLDGHPQRVGGRWLCWVHRKTVENPKPREDANVPLRFIDSVRR